MFPMKSCGRGFREPSANLHAAIARLPHTLIFDNSELHWPYRQVAAFDHGTLLQLEEPVPEWLRAIIPKKRHRKKI